MPIPSQIIATEPLSKDRMNRLMPKRRMLGETRHIYHYYRPSPDGERIVFGSRAGAETDDPIAKSRTCGETWSRYFWNWKTSRSPIHGGAMPDTPSIFSRSSSRMKAFGMLPDSVGLESSGRNGLARKPPMEFSAVRKPKPRSME